MKNLLARCLAFLGLGVMAGCTALLLWRGPDDSVGGPLTETPLQKTPEVGRASTLVPPPLEEFDLASAVESLKKLGTGEVTSSEECALFRNILEITERGTTPKELVELLEHVPYPDLIRDLVKAAFARLAAQDPIATVNAVGDLTNQRLRWFALDGAIEAWTEKDGEAALSFVLAQPPGHIREQGPRAVITAMAKRDPGATLERFRGTGLLFGGIRTGNMILYEWMQKDQAAAIQWLGDLEESESRERLIRSGAEELAGKDREAAFELASLLPDESRSALEGTLFRKWVDNDPEKAMAAVAKLPPERFTEKFSYMFGIHSAGADIDKAIAFAESIPDGDARGAYWQGLIVQRKGSDPHHAAELAANLPENKHREQTLHSLVSSWAQKDEHAASQWLATLPASPSRDVAVSTFARELFPIDPERAVAWAASIHDEKKRTHRLGKLLDQWHLQNNAAADAWIRANDTSSTPEQATNQ